MDNIKDTANKKAVAAKKAKQLQLRSRTANNGKPKTKPRQHATTTPQEENNSDLFYKWVQRSPDVDIVYSIPPDYKAGVLYNEGMLESEYRLPRKDWDNHVLSQDERNICDDCELRLA